MRRGPVTHEWIDQRSLAMNTEIAEMIREKPELMDVAKATLARWIKNSNPPSPAKLEWDAILKNSTTEEVLSLLTRWDEEARRLRQSSPFCGILPEERRTAIFAEFEQRLLVPAPATTKAAKPTIENSLAPLISQAEYQRELVEAFGEERAAICQLPEADRMAAWARIHNLQGDSPCDRAWPTGDRAETSRPQKRAGIHPGRTDQQWSGRSMMNWWPPGRSKSAQFRWHQCDQNKQRSTDRRTRMGGLGSTDNRVHHQEPSTV